MNRSLSWYWRRIKSYRPWWWIACGNSSCRSWGCRFGHWRWRVSNSLKSIPLRLVKTRGKSWRFGHWSISYGWGFDLGRYRLVWGRPKVDSK